MPCSKRVEVITEAHEGDAVLHDGVDATLNRLKQFYWPDMPTDVKSYVKSCRECQLRKAERQPPAGRMFSSEATRPLELVATDYLEMPRASLDNNKFVVVIVDVFTRFVFARHQIRSSTF